MFPNFVLLYISQGSAVTHLRCGEQCGMGFVPSFFGEYNSERILKMGKHLSKLRTNV